MKIIKFQGERAQPLARNMEPRWSLGINLNGIAYRRPRVLALGIRLSRPE